MGDEMTKRAQYEWERAEVAEAEAMHWAGKVSTDAELRLLDALRSGEMVAVPREMTDAMAEAMLEASGSTPADYWRAALTAAPEPEETP